MNNIALKIVSFLIGVLLPQVTPVIKEELNKFLQFVYAKAKETPNPVDDALAGVLLSIFGLETPTYTAKDVKLKAQEAQTEVFKDIANVTDK